jgi:hypothetical protein
MWLSGILTKELENQPPPQVLHPVQDLPRHHAWGQGKVGKTGDRLGENASAPLFFRIIVSKY